MKTSITNTKKEAESRKVSPDRSTEMAETPGKEPAAKDSDKDQIKDKNKDPAPELEPWTVNVRDNNGKPSVHLT